MFFTSPKSARAGGAGVVGASCPRAAAPPLHARCARWAPPEPTAAVTKVCRCARWAPEPTGKGVVHILLLRLLVNPGHKHHPALHSCGAEGGTGARGTSQQCGLQGLPGTAEEAAALQTLIDAWGCAGGSAGCRAAACRSQPRRGGAHILPGLGQPCLLAATRTAPLAAGPPPPWARGSRGPAGSRRRNEASRV